MSLGQPAPPAAEKGNPYIPQGPAPLIMEEWEGVDTQTTRAGVADEQCWWIDGFMPIKRRRLRTMYGVGTALFTAAGGLTVVFYKFANLGAIPVCIVVMSDGSVLQVRTDTGVQKTILAAGGITSPSQLTVDINQWGSKYVLIVSTQTNGYWIWDGAALYAAGTLGPVVTLTSAGSGYQSVPTITVVGGHGTGAVFAAAIANGVVTGVTLVSAGMGYLAGDTPSLVFHGGNSAGSGATLTAILSGGSSGSGGSLTLVVTQPGGGFGTNWAVTSVVIAAPGSGYSSNTVATVSGGSGSTHQAVLSLGFTAGAISSVNIVDSGLYASSTPAPHATITDPGGFTVSSVTVNSAGSGYSPSTVITASGGGAPTAQANLVPVITSGSITSVTINSGGVYGSNTPPTLTVTDTATNASATVELMPFAINGSTVETYAGHVWIGNGAIKYFSAPGSVTDFSTADGGGNATSNDSFLKVGYTRFIQTNGFLFEIADSSTNYVSGVTTSGSPATTSYTDQNADPEVGTVWPNTVTTWGNSVLLANSWGVHLLSGSRFDKKSDPMDGVYQSVPTQGITPSAAKAVVFNRRIWCLLLQIVDPVTATTQNKLLVWDGKRWWATLQDVTLTYVATQEINSVLLAWGTDGTHIYQLFKQPSTAFAKTVQSRLWDTPGGYLLEKAAGRFWGLLRYISTLSTNLILSLDNETNADPYVVPTGATYTITGPSGAGYFVIPPQAVGQMGALTGVTLKTNAADAEVVSVMVDDQVVGYRG